MSKGWTRFTSSCTSGSKSWTPIETRLNPRFRRTSRCRAVVTRGSTSTETSAPFAGRNVSRRCCARRSAWTGVRYVGVPPPQCTCSIDAGGVDALREEVDLPVEVGEVRLDLGAVLALPLGLRDDLHEAAAEPALLVAEREVGVEGDRRLLRVRAGAGLLVVLRADPFVPLGGGRVGGVPGALDVVFVEQLRRHRERLAAQADRDGRHGAEVSIRRDGSRSGRGGTDRPSPRDYPPFD